MATTLDHVMPMSWDNDDSLENLVPACGLCNGIASNKIFESVEHKRQYILSRRANHGNRRAICTECLLPYSYREHSPSLFLCAECYDREYGTHYAERECWKVWERELADAGIYPQAHKAARTKAGAYRKQDKKKAKEFMDVLITAYEEVEADLE